MLYANASIMRHLMLWVALKDKFDGISATKFRKLTIKFNIYKKGSTQETLYHLREISNMVKELKSTRHNLIINN